MIRVAVSGPPGMLRTGLEAILRTEADFELLPAVDTLDDVAAADVAIADVAVALESDLDAALTAELAFPLILIWPRIAPDQLRAALKAGVRGVLSHDCTPAELAAAIHAAAAGLTVLRASDMEALRLLAPDPQPSPGAVNLSPRELEVLRLLADGLANKEIGYRLGISEHTVKFHVNSILTRLDASTRAEAVAIGMRQGLILL